MTRLRDLGVKYKRYGADQLVTGLLLSAAKAQAVRPNAASAQQAVEKAVQPKCKPPSRQPAARSNNKKPAAQNAAGFLLELEEGLLNTRQSLFRKQLALAACAVSRWAGARRLQLLLAVSCRLRPFWVASASCLASGASVA